jgi:hypothetical protein
MSPEGAPRSTSAAPILRPLLTGDPRISPADAPAEPFTIPDSASESDHSPFSPCGSLVTGAPSASPRVGPRGRPLFFSQKQTFAIPIAAFLPSFVVPLP